jgi:hypothetical protein
MVEVGASRAASMSGKAVTHSTWPLPGEETAGTARAGGRASQKLVLN